MNIKFAAILVMISFCFLSCQSQKDQMEETMREIKRLDLLREKINEFLVEQQANMLAKKFEYEIWKTGQVAKAAHQKKEISRYQRSLKGIKEFFEEG